MCVARNRTRARALSLCLSLAAGRKKESSYVETETNS